MTSTETFVLLLIVTALATIAFILHDRRVRCRNCARVGWARVVNAIPVWPNPLGIAMRMSVLRCICGATTEAYA